MKITTWNVNSLNVRLPQLKDWLKEEQPAIVGLQEIKMVDEDVPVDEIEALGYQIAHYGQKTYNGVALISRSPIKDVDYNLPNFDDDEKRLIAGTIDGVRVINIYAPNGQSPESDKYQYKLNWYAALLEYVEIALKEHQEVIVIGDYNIAPTDDDVHNPKSWKDKILCTKPERKIFEDLLALGMVDGLRLYSQPAGLYTWWDYRRQGFEKNHGLRIDHLLASVELSRRIVGTEVHLDIRANERPSDHAPVSVVLKV